MPAKKHSAYTMIEMVMTIAVIGILLSIAYPSYRHIVQHQEKQAAQVALLKMATQMEDYYAKEKTYEGAQFEANSGHYHVSVIASNAEHYLLEARTNHAHLTLDERGIFKPKSG